MKNNLSKELCETSNSSIFTIGDTVKLVSNSDEIVLVGQILDSKIQCNKFTER